MKYSRANLIATYTAYLMQARGELKALALKMVESEQPSYELRFTGDKMIELSAQIDTCAQLVSALSDEKISLDQVKEWLMEGIISKAKYAERSTGVIANAMAREQLASTTKAYSERIARITELTA